ncbi:MAG: Gfo/Idh/MocA family oxidoreductase [Planctomycetota bacterium]
MIDTSIQLPTSPAPIVIIGAGGIVRDAHLPAYAKAGFPVFGICNIDRPPAEALANRYGIANVFETVEQAVEAAPERCVFDIAIMSPQFASTLAKLPDEACVLLQKPMGDDPAMTREIVAVCREKRLNLAVNCQLRYAPFVVAARRLINAGHLGQLHHMEVHVEVNTPWHRFPNVVPLPRLEIQQHSIHYFDLLRSFFGDPSRVWCRTVGNPAQPKLAATRTTAMLDFGDDVQATIFTNHGHVFGTKHQQSFIKWEGTRGVIKATMGLLQNYPDGVPDAFDYCLLDENGDGEWQSASLEGSWFPDAFIGTMADVQRHLEGSLTAMPTDWRDTLRTMACVEAAYASDGSGGVVPRYDDSE